MEARSIGYDEQKDTVLQDLEVRAAYEALEPAYQVACRRIEQGLTQAELAEKVGTKQSGISRLESGVQEPSLTLLKRVATALNCRLEVRLVPLDQASSACAQQESINQPAS